MRVEAKICGLRRPEDAAVAVERGASYLGVILVTGARRLVTAGEVSAIVAAAGPRPVLGVFGPSDADSILRMRDRTGIRGAQLHQGLDPASVARLRHEGLIVWRVARLAGPGDVGGLGAMAADADAVLVEPRVSGALGGTGVALDLDIAAAARGALSGRTMVLAGGLRPSTVAAAVRRVGPEIVDVSSGVEQEPGVKDPALIRSFLEALVGDHPSP